MKIILNFFFVRERALGLEGLILKLTPLYIQTIIANIAFYIDFRYRYCNKKSLYFKCTAFFLKKMPILQLLDLFA